MLVIQNFFKSYNGIPVLSFGELKLTTGIHWIKGENGSGKTTLFKSLAGLLPHQGEISFDDGINLKSNPEAFRKLVNYSEAEPLYPGFLTAKDLVRFIGKAKGSSLAQQKEIVDQLGIDSFFEKPCETFSSGMIKKLSLGLAFLGQPRVIILDEPLITLDDQARNVMFKLIRDSIAKSDVIFLISSHQLIANTSIEVNSTYLIQNKTLIPV